MKKLKAWIGLKIITFAIMIYESEPAFMYSDDDVENLTKLWKYYDQFKKELT